MVLSPASVRLMMTPELGETSGEQVYAEIPTEAIFDNCKVESQNENQIPFLCYIPSFLKVLKACEKSHKTTLKLSKKEKRAFLTIDSETNDQRVIQDLPIQLQPIKRIEECDEPMLDEPRVKVNMPNLKVLGTVVEKMKTISETIIVETASDGTMQFSVSQGVVNISTKFANLKVTNVGNTPTQLPAAPSPALAQSLIANAIAGGVVGDANVGVIPDSPLGANVSGVGPSISPSALGSAINDSQQQLPVETSRARISMKKFANLMQSKNLHAFITIGCIIEGAAFVMHIKLKQGRGIVTYYLPLMAE